MYSPYDQYGLGGTGIGSPFANTDAMSVNQPGMYDQGGQPMGSVQAPDAGPPAAMDQATGGVSKALPFLQTALSLYGIGTGESAQQKMAGKLGVPAKKLPKAPEFLSRTNQAGRAVGNTALNFVPAVGPILGAAGNLASGELGQRANEDYLSKIMAADPMLRNADVKLQNPYLKPSSGERRKRLVDSGVAAAGGVAAGAATGAAIGSVVPLAGTIVGGVVGAGLGALAGGRAKKRAEKRQEEMQAIADRNAQQLEMAHNNQVKQHEARATQMAQAQPNLHPAAPQFLQMLFQMAQKRGPNGQPLQPVMPAPGAPPAGFPGIGGY